MSSSSLPSSSSGDNLSQREQLAADADRMFKLLKQAYGDTDWEQLREKPVEKRVLVVTDDKNSGLCGGYEREAVVFFVGYEREAVVFFAARR